MGSDECSAGALRRAAVCGTLAASIFNTQPWRFELTASSLCLHSDPDRQLMAHDPDARLLLASCGCALFNARVSLACEGIGASVRRIGDGDSHPGRAALLATLTVGPDLPREGSAVSELAGAVNSRRTNRQQFTDDAVPIAVLQRIQESARAEGATLVPVPADRQPIVQQLVEQALTVIDSDASRLAERRAWSGAAGSPPRLEEEPLAGGTMALLCSTTESPLGWLRAGEGLERVLLELTRYGLRVGLSSDVAEALHVRGRLGEVLGLTDHPLVLLRIGHAPPTPATRRRRLVDVMLDPTEIGTGPADLGVI